MKDQNFYLPFFKKQKDGNIFDSGFNFIWNNPRLSTINKSQPKIYQKRPKKIRVQKWTKKSQYDTPQMSTASNPAVLKRASLRKINTLESPNKNESIIKKTKKYRIAPNRLKTQTVCSLPLTPCKKKLMALIQFHRDRIKHANH